MLLNPSFCIGHHFCDTQTYINGLVFYSRLSPFLAFPAFLLDLPVKIRCISAQEARIKPADTGVLLALWMAIEKGKIGIGHLHDGVILLLLPESSRVLLFCANQGFCYLNLTGTTKCKYERKNEMNSGINSKKTLSCKWPIHLRSGKWFSNQH